MADKPIFKVTAEDLELGDKQEQVVLPGDYFLMVTEPAYLDGIQTYANGTHVITIKGMPRR